MKKKREKKKGEMIAEAKSTQQSKKPPKVAEKKRPKLDAIVIKPAQGKSYAEVMTTIRAVKPEELGADVRSVRKTQSGDVLIELRHTKPEGRTALAEVLKKATGQSGNVRELTPRGSLEIRDLDCCATEEEVREALKSKLPEYRGELQVKVTKTNTAEQRAAIVVLEEVAAAHLLKTRLLRVGFVNCRVRRREIMTRCYRCLGYGHRSHGCKGPDRSACCYRCGQRGHKVAACTAIPECFLCKGEAKSEGRRHVAGSGACPTFREALSKKAKWS